MFSLVDVQKWHPDKHKGEDFARAKFQEINEAYQGFFYFSE
jgi:curved DNA-binding protein CbpA